MVNGFNLGALVEIEEEFTVDATPLIYKCIKYTN
jgi:hypothetical protein